MRQASTILSLAVATVLAAAAAHADTIAIVNAKAVTMTSAGIIDRATIVITDGKIVAIGAGVKAPTGATIVDAKGRLVTPGLFNSATQLGLVEVSSAEDTVDTSEKAGKLGAAFDVQYGLNFNSPLIPIARADGLTHAVVMPASSADAPFVGQGAVIGLGPSGRLLERRKAAMYASVGGDTTSDFGQSRSAQWLLLRNALDEARDYKANTSTYRTAAGRDHLLKRPDIVSLQPVVEGAMPLVIQAKRESDIRQAVALAEDYGLRVVILGGNEAWRAARLLAAKKIPVILTPFDNLPTTFDEIGSRADNAAILHKAGVRIGLYAPSIHMSHNAGLVLRQGAGIAVANGLPWHAAMQALTSSPAQIWGLGDHAGSIELGRPADLVVWSGDPLQMTSAPEIVFADGVRTSLENRQTKLRDRYRPKPK